MKNVKLLWLLQELEKKENEFSQTCRQNPTLLELRKQREKLLARQADFEMQREKYYALVRHIKEKEDNISLITDKQTEILKVMYDGSVTNSKELAKLQQQSLQLKNQASSFEEEQLQKMEEKERLLIFLRVEQHQLAAEVAEFKKQKMLYEMEKLNIDQEIAELGEEKERILIQISPQSLKKFRASQKAFNGSPIALVTVNLLCTFCHVEMNRHVAESAKQAPGKVSCESCGRILYVE